MDASERKEPVQGPARPQNESARSLRALAASVQLRKPQPAQLAQTDHHQELA